MREYAKKRIMEIYREIKEIRVNLPYEPIERKRKQHTERADRLREEREILLKLFIDICQIELTASKRISRIWK
mgnify:FL=1|jgi:hypothetical protein|tara:strand:+ start:71 stop:289 length:219 start_codon:yes stop_codon:yes gene_type:complete